MKFLTPLLQKFRKPKVEVIVKGPSFVFGIPETIKPVRGVDGKAQAKLVLRADQMAELVMLSDSQDSTFLLEDRGDYWIVDKEIRREVIVK